MRKLIIITLFSVFCSCSQEANTKKLSALEYMKINQNNDGSWGDKNKVYCSSVALLTYLTSFKSISSKLYGKSIFNGLKFLLQKQDQVSDEDLHIYLWAISEAYSFTDSQELAAVMKRKLPDFKKSISWDYIQFPTQFFTQNQALHAFRKSFYEYEKFEVFLSKLKELKGNSLSLLSVKRQWQMNPPNTDTIKSLIKTSLSATNKNYIDDMLLGRYLFLDAKNDQRKVFQNKIEAYIRGDLNYKFERRFSIKEQRTLTKITPLLVYEFSFPMRYLPSSNDVISQEENEDNLDLIED